MDIVFAKKEFLRLVSRCQGVVDRKSAMPTLADVLVVAAGGDVAVSATNLYQHVTGSTSAEVAKPGGVCLNAADLRERLSAMPDGPVRLRVLKDRAELTAVGTKRRFALSTREASDFPPAPGRDDPKTITVGTEALVDMIERVYLAISRDATRAHVNSMLLECSDSTLRCVATDGHRLSLATRSHPDAFAPVLVPLTALTEIRKILAGAPEEQITLGVSGPNLHFAADGFTFTCKLVDAAFPPYQQVIPKDSMCTVTMPRLGLIDALKAVSVASSDRTGGVALEFEADFVTVTAQSPEGGDASDVVTCTGGPSKAVRIGFNAGYLVDALSVLDGDEVTFGFTGELDPAVVRAEGFVGVVMPMRV